MSALEKLRAGLEETQHVRGGVVEVLDDHVLQFEMSLDYLRRVEAELALYRDALTAIRDQGMDARMCMITAKNALADGEAAS